MECGARSRHRAHPSTQNENCVVFCKQAERDDSDAGATGQSEDDVRVVAA